jgi:ubiquinone/menaquinone biosynthesis C-methylase UbiE
MEEKKVQRIKAAVQGNFDQSPDAYQDYEERYQFFADLNARLIGKMDIPANGVILDVGCGTGASSIQLLDAVPDSRVVGLDNSPAMLARARELHGESSRLTFIERDAAELEELGRDMFDAVIYSASIFLIPDYEQSLTQARAILKPHGSVGLTFMDGLYDPFGKNALAVADRDAQQGVSLRKPVELAKLHALFRRLFPKELTWKEDMVLAKEQLLEFFSVPAMSAGLFPQDEYATRVKKISVLLDHLPRTQNIFRWVLMVGRLQ